MRHGAGHMSRPALGRRWRDKRQQLMAHHAAPSNCYLPTVRPRCCRHCATGFHKSWRTHVSGEERAQHATDGAGEVQRAEGAAPRCRRVIVRDQRLPRRDHQRQADAVDGPQRRAGLDGTAGIAVGSSLIIGKAPSQDVSGQHEGV